jgi:aminomethyltransferase
MPVLGHQEVAVGAIPCRIMRREWVSASSATLIVAREYVVPLWDALDERVRDHGGIPAGMEALNSIRLESGTPWFGRDYDDKNIPHEAGLEHSHISYEKGCYTGQEIVERVRSRGHVNRRLTSLKFLAAESPVPGAKLFTADTTNPVEVGSVTSTAFSPLLQAPIGLGYVRREHSAVGNRLDASGTLTEIVSLTAT